MLKTVSVRKRLFQQRRFRYLLFVLLIISVIIGVLIVPVERSLGNITSLSDGAWWAVTTVTTVGYGDLVPVTPLGRIMGSILQVLGAMIFGIMIAMISIYLNRSQEEFYWNRLFERLDRIEKELDELKRRTGYMVKNADEAETQNTNHMQTTDPATERQ